jgi:hypothetical protein
MSKQLVRPADVRWSSCADKTRTGTAHSGEVFGALGGLNSGCQPIHFCQVTTSTNPISASWETSLFSSVNVLV